MSFKIKTLVVFGLVLPAGLLAAAAPRGFIHVNLSYHRSFDSGYTGLYGPGHLLPEVRLGWRVFHGFYVWAGYGFLSSRGTIPVVEAPARSVQNFLLAGLGWMSRFRGRLQLNLFLGAADVVYREDTMDIVLRHSVLGLNTGGGLCYFLNDRLFFSLQGSYIYAQDQVGDTLTTPGGLSLGAGVGFRF